MAPCFLTECLKLICRGNYGRFFIKIVIFIIVIVPSTRVDALSLEEDFEIVLNADDAQNNSIPPCKRNPVIGIPIDLQVSPNKITVALTYEESYFPNRPFELILYKGDSTLNCSSVRCRLRVGESRYISDKSSSYDNLEPGYYCARLLYGECPYRSSTELVKDSDIHTNAAAVDKPLQKWVYVVLGIGVSGVVFLVFVLVWCCNQRTVNEHFPFTARNRKSLRDAIKTENPMPVFLLYDSDCDHHLSVMRKLAEFLEQNYCKVSCEYKEKAEMVVNKVSWMHERLSGRFKILLVNSKMAFLKQKLWLNYRNSKEIKSLSDDLFLHALTIISHRIKQKYDYKNLFMLLPSYISKKYILSDICPGKHYEFPRYLAMLLCHLHNVNPQSVDFEEPCMSWDYCASTYDDLQCLVNSMTAYDDRGNLITGCKQCDARVMDNKLNGDLIHV